MQGNMIDRDVKQNGSGVSESETMYSLTSTDRHGVAIPINTQIATRHISLGERTGMGWGKDGDPAYTLQAGHEHAVCCLLNDQVFQINIIHLQYNFEEELVQIYCFYIFL